MDEYYRRNYCREFQEACRRELWIRDLIGSPDGKEILAAIRDWQPMGPCTLKSELAFCVFMGAKDEMHKKHFDIKTKTELLIFGYEEHWGAYPDEWKVWEKFADDSDNEADDESDPTGWYTRSPNPNSISRCLFDSSDESSDGE